MALLRAADLRYQAQRNAVLGRLARAAHADPLEAEQWIVQWEGHAASVGVRRDSPTYWNAALRWIADRRGPQ